MRKTLLHRARVGWDSQVGEKIKNSVATSSALLQAISAGAVADFKDRWSHSFNTDSLEQWSKNNGYINSDGSYSGKVFGH